MHWPVIAFEEIDSTNKEAQRRLSSGAVDGTWITAARQTAGRGRSGRSWQSLDGNLFASLVLPLDCEPNVLHHLSLVSGVALRNAVSSCCEGQVTQIDVRLKWPNDVLINEAKVAGILVESSIIGTRVVAIIGIGVNLQTAPELSDRKTARLAAFGISHTPAEFLEALDKAFFDAISRWDNGTGFDLIRHAWLNHSFSVGQPISINATDGRVHGAFAGLDEDGALLIRASDGKISVFHFGDVAIGGEAATDANGDTKIT